MSEAKVVSKLPVQFQFGPVTITLRVDAPIAQRGAVADEETDDYYDRDYAPTLVSTLVMQESDGSAFKWNAVDIWDLLRDFEIHFKGFACLGLLTCECGVPGCAGVEDFLIEYGDTQVCWHIDRKLGHDMPKVTERITFDRNEYFALCDQFRTFVREFLKDVDAEPGSEFDNNRHRMNDDEKLYRERICDYKQNRGIPSLAQVRVSGFPLKTLNQMYQGAAWIMYIRLHALQTGASREASVYGDAQKLRAVAKLLKSKCRLVWRKEHRAGLVLALGERSPKVEVHGMDILCEALTLPQYASMTGDMASLLSFVAGLTKQDVVRMAEELVSAVTDLPLVWRELYSEDDEGNVVLPDEIDWVGRYAALRDDIVPSDGGAVRWFLMEHEFIRFLSIIKVCG